MGITNDQRLAIEKSFTERLVANGINPKSKKGLNMQAEFFSGALAAIQTLLAEPNADKLIGPAYWVIAIMSGRVIGEK